MSGSPWRTRITAPGRDVVFEVAKTSSAERASTMIPQVRESLSGLPQRLHMRQGRLPQRLQVVATLEGGDNPAAGSGVGHRDHGPGRPGEVLRLQRLAGQ